MGTSSPNDLPVGWPEELAYEPDKPRSEPLPELWPSGSLKLRYDMTFLEALRLVRAYLDHEGLIDEYFSPNEQPCRGKIFETIERGSYRWIACYAVTGGSEGHYIHIDAVSGYSDGNVGECLHLLTGKTFLGLDHAIKIAGRCTQLLASI